MNLYDSSDDDLSDAYGGNSDVSSSDGEGFEKMRRDFFEKDSDDDKEYEWTFKPGKLNLANLDMDDDLSVGSDNHFTHIRNGKTFTMPVKEDDEQSIGSAPEFQIMEPNKALRGKTPLLRKNIDIGDYLGDGGGGDGLEYKDDAGTDFHGEPEMKNARSEYGEPARGEHKAIENAKPSRGGGREESRRIIREALQRRGVRPTGGGVEERPVQATPARVRVRATRAGPSAQAPVSTTALAVSGRARQPKATKTTETRLVPATTTSEVQSGAVVSKAKSDKAKRAVIAEARKMVKAKKAKQAKQATKLLKAKKAGVRFTVGETRASLARAKSRAKALPTVDERVEVSEISTPEPNILKKGRGRSKSVSTIGTYALEGGRSRRQSNATEQTGLLSTAPVEKQPIDTLKAYGGKNLHGISIKAGAYTTFQFEGKSITKKALESDAGLRKRVSDALTRSIIDDPANADITSLIRRRFGLTTEGDIRETRGYVRKPKGGAGEK